MLASERGEPAPLDDVDRPPPTPTCLDLPVEAPPSLGEAWRTVWKIGVLRRIFIALPFLAAAIAGFTSLASLQYQETFHLDAVQRAYLIAPIQLFDLLGLAVGAVIATRLARRDIGLVFRMLAVASLVAAAFAVLFALAPNVPLAFVGNAGIDFSLAIVGPGRAGLALARHPVAGALRGLLHRRAVRAARLPRAPDRRGGGRRRGLPLRPAHPRPHLRHRRAHRGQRRRPHRTRRAGRVDLHAHAEPDADGPPGRPAAAAGRARAQRGLRRRRRPGRRGHRDRRGGDRRPRRHQRRRQVDAAAGHRRGGRGRPRRHRLRRARHHPPAPRRDRPPRRGPGARRRGDLPQSARGGQPARGGLAGPAPRRARRRHDRRGARPPSPPWPRGATSGPPTSRAASSRCSPSPWRPSPGPSCSSSTSSRSGSPPSWSSSCSAPSSRCARAAPPSCSSSSP